MLDEEDLRLLRLVRDRKASFGLTDPNDAQQVQEMIGIEARLQVMATAGLTSSVLSVPNHQTRHGGFAQVFVSSIWPRGLAELRMHDPEALLSALADAVRGQVELDTGRRAGEVDRDIRQITSEHAGRGMVTSGFYLEAVASRIRAEVEPTATGIAQRWANAVRHSGFVLTQEAVAAIGAHEAEYLRAISGKWQQTYWDAHKKSGSSVQPDLDLSTHLAQTFSATLTYLRVAPGAPAAAPGHAPMSILNFNAAVQSVQTGSHASAVNKQVAISVDFADVTRSLGDLAQLVNEANLSEDVRQGLSQTLNDAVLEAGKSNPNTTRLATLVMGACNVIQATAAAPAALEVGRGILGSLGFQVG